MTRSSHLAFAIVVALLVLSIPAAQLIPFHEFLGLDFHNMDVFHDCAARDDPYVASGAMCGDVYSRDMTYPPLLYWLFAWTRITSLSAGALIWAAVILVGVLGSLIAWTSPRQRDLPTLVFIALLMLQFPTLFQVERGNSDVIVLVAWTAAARLFVTGRYASAGGPAAFAAAAKLYPIAACVVVGVGVLGWALRDAAGRRPLLGFTVGGAIVAVLVGLLFFDQNVRYLSETVPARADWVVSPIVHGHSLEHIAPWGTTWVLIAPLLMVWSVATARLMPDRALWAFAGGLGLSTYVFPSSFDYNLVTAYPLLLLQFLWLMRSFRIESARRRLVPVVLLVTGLVAIVGNRLPFDDTELLLLLHVWLQYAWLLGVGLLAVIRPVMLPADRPLGGLWAGSLHRRKLPVA